MNNSVLNNKYDAITCFEVLQHVPNPEETIKQFRDHLNGYGLLIITTRFKNNYNLALSKNKKYHGAFSNIIEKIGFIFIDNKYLCGPKGNEKYLNVFIKKSHL